MNPPITLREILIEEYLTPMGIPQNAMARAIGVAPRVINKIVLGHRSITPVMSIRFGAFFGQMPEFWHGLQVEYDFRSLGKKQKQLTAKIRPAQTLGHAAQLIFAVKSSHMTPSDRLTASEMQIVAEMIAVQGKPADIGGYYQPDNAKAPAARRPCKMLNDILAPV